jgi:CRP-like cAMP-binding protein
MADMKDLEKQLPERNLFDDLPNDEFKRLLGIAKRVKVPAGTVLLREGEEGDAVRIMLTGRVKVYKTAEDATEIGIAELESGSVFGEMGVFDNLPNSASVIAVQDSFLLEIPRAALLDFLQANPKVAITLMGTIIHILSVRIRKSNIYVSNVHGTNTRIADSFSDALDGLLKD